MALSNIEIEKKLGSLPGFLGVFSKDELPLFGNNKCAIVNIQDSVSDNGQPLPGTHWVACGVKSGKSWYTDSFGLAPLHSLKNKLRNPIAYQTREVQDKKSVKCGYYAMLSCLEITHSRDTPDITIENIVNDFNEFDLYNNDKILKKKLGKYKIHM